jgi:hypothetical protein
MRNGDFVFYDTDHLSIQEKAALLRDCKEVSYTWWADTLDCSVSIARQKYDCTFEEILAHLTQAALVVVIDRGTWHNPLGSFEVGFRSMGQVDYFLFIHVECSKMPPIIDKYHLPVLFPR